MSRTLSLASPKITIVMPSFNQAAYLDESICSVLDQCYPKLEFIVLDGGSNDGSLEILKRYSHYFSYWHSQPDKGQTDALIQGFSRATGSIFGWLNSDDVLLPGALLKIAHAVETHPDYGLFGGNLVYINCNSRIIRCKRLHPLSAWFSRNGHFVLAQPGSFFRKEDYYAVGGLNSELHYVMDAELYIRMLLFGTKYCHINEFLSGFRLQPMSKTVAHREKSLQEFESALGIYFFGKNRFWLNQLYRVLQTVNFNYFLMIMETLITKGKYWRNWDFTENRRFPSLGFSRFK